MSGLQTTITLDTEISEEVGMRNIINSAKDVDIPIHLSGMQIDLYVLILFCS